MSYLKSICTMCTSLLIFLIAPAFAFAAEPSVIISEVAWAGSALSTSDEWIELTNVTDQSINLSGWQLNGASKNPLAIPDGSTLSAYSTFLISNYDHTHEKSALDRAPNLVSSSISLSNSKLHITLTDADGTLIDTAGSGGRPPAGSSGGTGDTNTFITMSRRTPVLSGDTADAWENSATSTGLTHPEQHLGTPGVHSVSKPEPTPEPKETLNEFPVTSMQYPPRTLVINELMVDPLEGQDEWVEILNPYNNVIRITNWSIEDSSGKKTYLPDQYLGFEQIIVIKNPIGKLNNGKDVLTLRSPNGSVIDRVSYGSEFIPAPKETQTLARVEEGVYQITIDPTPHVANNIVRPPVKQKTIASTSREIAKQPEPKKEPEKNPEPQKPFFNQIPKPTTTPITIALEEPTSKEAIEPVQKESTEVIQTTQEPVVVKPVAKKITRKKTPAFYIRSLSDLNSGLNGKRVQTTGVITTLPGQVNSRSIYIQNGEHAIELYKHDAVFPNLELGQSVRVRGILGEAYGQPRLKIDKLGFITPIGDTASIVPKILTQQNLATSSSGQLVSIEGIVEEKTKNTLTASMGNTSIVIKIPYKQSFEQDIPYGSTVRATGILLLGGKDIKLLTRSPQDLEVIKKPDALAGTTALTGKEQGNKTAAQIAILILAATVTFLSALALRHVAPKIKTAYEQFRDRRSQEAQAAS